MHIEPYLFFEGRCEEALEFYRSSLGAEVTFMMRYNESPEPGECPVSDPNKIMHANLRIGESNVMVSDGRCENKPNFEGFALSLAVTDKSEAEKMFNALADGGKVQMPLTKTFWSPLFGMVSDKFGVWWMINMIQ